MAQRRLHKNIILFLVLFLSSAQGFAAANRLFIADFETGDFRKYTNAWEHNIFDDSQSIKAKLIDHDASGKIHGKALALKFDVESSHPAMVGFVIRLQNKDLSGFDTLHISFRSGEEERFAGNIALQFIDEDGRRAPYLLSGISSEWKEYRIPLEKFKRINDWSRVKEFELIIDDINARPKEGVLFVDEIYVSNSEEE